MMERLTRRLNRASTARISKANPYTSNRTYKDLCGRLGEYEDLEEQGLLLRLPEGMTLGVIALIMTMCENVNANKVATGGEREPLITWQLYNALLKLGEDGRKE